MKSILRFEEGFTANLDPAQIPYSNIATMDYVFRGIQNGATQPELDAVMSQISEVRISSKDDVLKGNTIDGMDLLALSMMYLGVTPQTVEPGGNNENFLVGPVVLPVNLPALAEGLTPRYHLNFTNDGDTDNEDITIGLEHDIPIGGRYTYVKHGDTGATGGTSVDISSDDGLMKALLMKLTNKPTTSDFTTDIQRLKLRVGGSVLYDYALGEIGLGKAPFNLDDHDWIGPALAAYRILLFPSGVPTSNLTVWTESDTETGAIEFIQVLQA